MDYVEGIVAAAPAADREAHRKYAAEVAPLFKAFGPHNRTWATTCPTARSPTSRAQRRRRTTRDRLRLDLAIGSFGVDKIVVF